MRNLVIFFIPFLFFGCVSKKQHHRALLEQEQRLESLEGKLKIANENTDSLSRELLFSQGGNALLLEAHSQLQERLLGLEEERKKLQNNLSNTQQDLRDRLEKLEAKKQQIQQAQKTLKQRYQAVLAAFSQPFDSIAAAWQQDSLFQQLIVKSQAGGLSIHIPEELIFQGNSQRIQPKAPPSFQRITELLQQNARWNISIIGHTDSQERRRSPNNWAYSAQQAVIVAQELADSYYISANRISAVGKGDSSPLQSNATAAGRAANRRIEFQVSNSLAYLLKTLDALSRE